MIKWFKHDSDANTDAKLRRVRMKYGMEGYGLFWYCLELISAGVDKYHLTFELEHDSEIIAFDTGIHRERVEEMMTYFVDQKLFENSNGTITCLKMANRTDEYISRLIPRVSGQTPDGVPRLSGQSSPRREENRREETRGEETRRESPDGDAGAGAPCPACPHQQIIDAYHDILPGLRQVTEWTDNRKRLLRTRWREKPERQSLDWWREYFRRVSASDFLMGRVKDFQADLEWLIRPTNMPKVLEGKYDKSEQNGGYVDNSGAAAEAKRRFREKQSASG